MDERPDSKVHNKKEKPVILSEPGFPATGLRRSGGKWGPKHFSARVSRPVCAVWGGGW